MDTIGVHLEQIDIVLIDKNSYKLCCSLSPLLAKSLPSQMLIGGEGLDTSDMPLSLFRLVVPNTQRGGAKPRFFSFPPVFPQPFNEKLIANQSRIIKHNSHSCRYPTPYKTLPSFQNPQSRSQIPTSKTITHRPKNLPQVINMVFP